MFAKIETVCIRFAIASKLRKPSESYLFKCWLKIDWSFQIPKTFTDTQNFVNLSALLEPMFGNGLNFSRRSDLQIFCYHSQVSLHTFSGEIQLKH